MSFGRAIRTLLPNTLGAAFLASLLVVPSLWAGPSPPLIYAASSSNGEFMVLLEYQRTNPEASMERRPWNFTYRIVKKEKFLSFPRIFTGPAVYWSEAWELTKSQSGPTIPLITNDGKFLILLSQSAPSSEAMEVVRIYRQNTENSGADLVGSCLLENFWPTDKLPSNKIWVVNDHTPMWSEDGSFEFSSDNGELIHRTRWGNTVRIQLKSGATNSQCPVLPAR